MNSNKYIYLLFILSFIVSCKQNPKQEEQNIDAPKEIVRSIDCFKYLHKKDTVYMKTITQKIRQKNKWAMQKAWLMGKKTI